MLQANATEVLLAKRATVEPQGEEIATQSILHP
jgi:hypothetical protein